MMVVIDRTLNSTLLDLAEDAGRLGPLLEEFAKQKKPSMNALFNQLSGGSTHPTVAILSRKGDSKDFDVLHTPEFRGHFVSDACLERISNFLDCSLGEQDALREAQHHDIRQWHQQLLDEMEDPTQRGFMAYRMALHCGFGGQSELIKTMTSIPAVRASDNYGTILNQLRRNFATSNLAITMRAPLEKCLREKLEISIDKGICQPSDREQLDAMLAIYDAHTKFTGLPIQKTGPQRGE